MFEGSTSVSISSVSSEKSDFCLGAVVLPATDGFLADLGFDVKELGPLALGVVVEEGSKRSHIHFPELRRSLWLDHREIKDVRDEMQVNSRFAIMQKYFETPDAEKLSPFFINKLVHFLKATHVLGYDHGKLSDVWEEAADRLKDYYSGDSQVEVTRLSLGVEEYLPQEWEKFISTLGGRILLTRFLPSGMHKLELSIYFRRI